MKKLHNPLLPKKGGLGVLALFGILFITLIFVFYFWPTNELVAKHTIVEQQINTAITQQLAEKKIDTNITPPKLTGVVSLDDPKPKIDPELVKELKELKKQNRHKRVTILVELKDDQALEAIKQAGGTVQQNFDIGNVAVVEISSDKVEEISNSTGVEQVSSEKEYVAFLADRIPAFSIDAAAWANNITGKGVKIAILDTGVGPHNKITVANGASFVEGENGSDQNGHGTHVAGIAQGVAKDSTIYNAKVLNKAGAGTTSQIIAGINWAVEQNVDIISMSFGGMFTELDGPLASAVKDAINHGVVFVVAAGNCKTGCGGFYGVTTPGNVKEVITVGAVDDSNIILPFSSGDTFDSYVKPDVVGPGKDITSTWLNNGEKTLSGTSMSTPFVAGIAALLLEKEPGLTNEQVKQKLESTATDLGETGKDASYGAGIIDVPSLLGIIQLGNSTNKSIPNNVAREQFPVPQNAPNYDFMDINSFTISEDSILKGETVDFQIAAKNTHNESVDVLFAIFLGAEGYPAGMSYRNITTLQPGDNYVTASIPLSHVTGNYYVYAQLLAGNITEKSSNRTITITTTDTATIQDVIIPPEIYTHTKFPIYVVLQNTDDVPKFCIVRGKLLKGEEIIDEFKIGRTEFSGNDVFNYLYVVKENGSHELTIGIDCEGHAHETRRELVVSTSPAQNITAQENWKPDLIVSMESQILSNLTGREKARYEFIKRQREKYKPGETAESTENYTAQAAYDTYCDFDANYGNERCQYNGHYKNQASRSSLRGTWFYDERGDNTIPKYEEQDAYVAAGAFVHDVTSSRLRFTYDAQAFEYYNPNEGAKCTSNPLLLGFQCNVDVLDLDCDGSNIYSNDPCIGICSGLSSESSQCNSLSRGNYWIDVWAHIYDVDGDPWPDVWGTDLAYFDCLSNNDCLSGESCVFGTNPAGDNTAGSACICPNDASCNSCLDRSNSQSCDCGSECSGGYCWASSTSYTCHGSCATQGNYAPSSSQCCGGLVWNSQTNLCTQPCTAGATGTKRCNGATVQTEYRNTDCSTYWVDEQTCSGEMKCSSGACVQKTCSDFGLNSGSCSTENSRSRSNNKAYECQDQVGGAGQVLCLVQISSLGNSDWCNVLTTFGETCNYGEYDCNWDSECFSGGSCLGIPLIGDHGCCNSVDTWDTNSKVCKKSDGQTCQFGYQCQSGNCATGICSPPTACNNNNVCETGNGENAQNCGDCKPNGAQCSNNNQCETASCVNNICGGSLSCNNNGVCDGSETNANCPNDCPPTATCADNDGDNYGNPGSSACSGGSQTDCDDLNPNVKPGIAENCDTSFDDNCANGVNENCCGNGQCNAFENPTNCNQDCFGNLQVISIVNAPFEVDQGQNVQITAQVKNLGTYSQTLKIEAGIAPDYWQGTIFSQDVNAQSYFTVTKCCSGNDYYDAKQITLNAGESENVVFNVKAPTVSSIDTCSTNNLFKSAWDSSHTVLVALYSACGSSYTDKDLKDIHVKDKPCGQPSDCNTATEYCKIVGTTGTCQPKICFDRCTPNSNRCDGNAVQHCEDTNGDGCVEWRDTATCRNGYTCISGACEYTSVRTTFSLENAGSNTVLKQKGDIVSMGLKYAVTEPITLEYDTTKFLLNTTTCPGSSFTITSDKTCRFTVIGNPGSTEYPIKLKYGGSGKVKIIQNPTGIILTSVPKLHQRFPEAQNQVNDLLQKAYNFAYNKNLVVYNLANYMGTAHPWTAFSSYAEQPTNPFMKNNAYSLEVGQFVREKCKESCKNTIILGDDFVVPHYRRDAQFINNYWIFGQTEKVDHIYSDLSYIGRKDKPFSQFKDLFYFDGEYDGKKVIIIKPDSLSSSMQAELNHFKQVLTTKFGPNFVEIQASTVGCNDGTFFSTFDGATLLVVGTNQNNPAYNCMPFVSELESSDTAFIEVNPWDGSNYAIIVNTDDSKVLQAFTAFIETNKFEKTTSKVLWWIEVGLDAASYLSILCSAGTLLPCDQITDAASTEFYCAIKGSVPLCAVNVAMLAVPYIPTAPVKAVVKKFMVEVGDFAAQLVRDTGDEIVDIFIRAYRRGKLDEVFEVLKKMSNCFTTAEYSIQAGSCPGDEFYKLFIARRPRFIIDHAHDMARANHAVLMRASKAGSTTSVSDIKFVRMLDSEIPVNDGQIKNFVPIPEKPRVGTVQIDGKTYFFKRGEGLQRDMYPANVRERIRHRLNFLLDEKDADIIVPKTRMADEVEISVDVDDSGLLVEAVEGTDAWKLYKSVEDSFNNEQFPQLRFFQKTSLITEKQKNTMRKMIIRDFVFGTGDRNLGNAIISGTDKVGFIDFEHFLVDVTDGDAISPLLKTPPTISAMFSNDPKTIVGKHLTNQPQYKDLAVRWTDYGPAEQKKIIDLLEPEARKLSSLSDDDVRALFELDDSVSQAALQQAREILVGQNGRIKSFVADFYRTKAAVEALQ